jgi:hypothetical protein
MARHGDIAAAWLTALSVLLASRQLLANEAKVLGSEAKDASNWEQRPIALELHLGFGAPTGFIGAGLDYSVSKRFSLGTAVGASTGGGQIAAILGGRIFGNRKNAFALHLSGSAGGYDGHRSPPVDGSTLPDERRVIDWAFWGNLAAAYERRTDSGFALKAFLGYAVLLNPGDAECRTAEDAPIDCGSTRLGATDVLPFIGVVLGYALRD